MKPIADYQLIAELKRGPYATVYRAYESARERFVLLKVLHASESATRLRFEKEATHLAKLKHDNLVRVLQHGEAQLPSGKTCAFLALEFIEGQTLAEVMHERKLPPDLALYLAREMLAALAAAHEQQLVHRDLKPQNILLDHEGRVKVTDFGLAAMMGGDEEQREIVGTPQYMSPEQARGEAVTAGSDLFSLGVVLYEMLAAISPFDGESMVARIYRVTHETPAPLARMLAPECARLSALVQRLLEKNPQQRFAEAAQVLQEVHACEEELGQRAFAEDLRRYLNEPEHYQPRALVRRAAPRTSLSTRGWRYSAFALLCFITLAGAWQLSQQRLTKGASTAQAPPANEAVLTSNHVQASSSSQKEKEPSNAPSKLAFDSTLEHTNEEAESEALPQKLLVEEEKAAETSYLRLACWPMAYAVLHGDTLGPVDLEPTRFEVPAGKIILTLRNPRFPAVQQVLQLSAGDTLDYKISLWEKVVALTLNVQPWAEVNIDGVSHGKTPFGEIMLAPGMHTFTFTHPERETFVLQRAFVAGQRDTLNIELRKR
ncbi:MAG: serine/threonine-protein kinase [candidate division KSB1 bacterium]